MKLIVGLGNPGKKYENTRHNIGFIYCDKLVTEFNEKFQNKFEAEISRFHLDGEDIIIAKPQTFMNNSGTSVYQIAKFYKINTDDILLIYDDLDMEFGKIKIKHDSSAGGHNGVKDIINKLHTQKLKRIKIGILNEYKRDVKDFVLSKFSKEEIKELNQLYPQIKELIHNFINNTL